MLAALVNTGIADANIKKTSIKTAINEASSTKVQASEIVGCSTDTASNHRIFKEYERIIWGNTLSAERPSTLSEYSVSNLRACYMSESNRDELNPFPARVADMGESEENGYHDRVFKRSAPYPPNRRR